MRRTESKKRRSGSKIWDGLTPQKIKTDWRKLEGWLKKLEGVTLPYPHQQKRKKKGRTDSKNQQDWFGKVRRTDSKSQKDWTEKMGRSTQKKWEGLNRKSRKDWFEKWEELTQTLFSNQKNDFKILFALSSSFLDFQYTKMLLGKL